MTFTQIKIRWRINGTKTKATKDVRKYKGSGMFDTLPEIAKRVVADELGHPYNNIEFELFERSLFDECKG